MTTPVTMVDEHGNTTLIVDRGLVVSPNPVPSPSSSGKLIQLPFIQSLSIDGTGLGDSINLMVDGSLADPVDAFISAISGADIYIKTANIFIEGGANLLLKDFGTIVDGLDNGINTARLRCNSRRISQWDKYFC